MAVKPEQALRRCMRSWRLSSFVKQPASGSKNLLHLTRDRAGKAVLLKCAPNPFDAGVTREANVLQALAPVMGRGLLLPKRLAFDPSAQVLALEWLRSAPTLHDSLCTTRRLAVRLLLELGRSLAQLHLRSARAQPLFDWATAPDETLLDCFIWTRPAFASRLSIDGTLLIGSVQSDLRARAGLIELSGNAHARCLIHGDVKLPNLLVTRRGPVLIDWELAQWGDPAQDLGSLTADLMRRQIAPDSAREALDPRALAQALAAIRRGYASVGGPLGLALRRRVRLWSGAHLLFYAHALVLAEGALSWASQALALRARSLLSEVPRAD